MRESKTERKEGVNAAVKGFRKALYETAARAGLKLLGDDTCCQLLAWLLVYGGGNEEVVMNEEKRVLFEAAQERLNLYGGESANWALVPYVQEYVKSVEDFYNPPGWVSELERRYKLAPQRRKLFAGADGRVLL